MKLLLLMQLLCCLGYFGHLIFPQISLAAFAIKEHATTIFPHFTDMALRNRITQTTQSIEGHLENALASMRAAEVAAELAELYGEASITRKAVELLMEVKEVAAKMDFAPTLSQMGKCC